MSSVICAERREENIESEVRRTWLGGVAPCLGAKTVPSHLLTVSSFVQVRGDCCICVAGELADAPCVKLQAQASVTSGDQV